MEWNGMDTGTDKKHFSSIRTTQSQLRLNETFFFKTNKNIQWE